MVDSSGWWLTYPSEKYESVGMMTFPTESKVIKAMFQTTNQFWLMAKSCSIPISKYFHIPYIRNQYFSTGRSCRPNSLASCRRSKTPNLLESGAGSFKHQVQKS